MSKPGTVRWSWVLVLLVLAIVVSGCGGLKPNEETKQTIMSNLHPQLKPISDFRFLESTVEGEVMFEFRAANGLMYQGTFDGEYLDVSAK